jgi:hypothetical protein
VSATACVTPQRGDRRFNVAATGKADGRLLGIAVCGVAARMGAILPCRQARAGPAGQEPRTADVGRARRALGQINHPHSQSLPPNPARPRFHGLTHSTAMMTVPQLVTDRDVASPRASTQSRRSAWDRGPMRIKAGVIEIWAFCVPAVVSVIRDGTCPAGGQR